MNNLKKVLLGIGFVGIVGGCTVGICLTMNPKKVESASCEENQLAAHYNATDVEFCKEAQLNFNTDTQTFRYYPSVVSSVVLTGMYEISGTQITLKPERNEEILVFQVDGDILKFDKAASTMDTKLANGTIFQERISE